MAKGGRIDYTVGFKADLSGLNSVKKSFKDIQNLTAQEYMIKFSTSNNLKQASAELEKIKTQAAAVELAFNKSFDAKLGTVNIKQFNNELLKTKINADDLFNSFARVGQEDVFAKLMRGAITANVQIKQTSKFLDDIGHTLTSTVRWGIASRLMNDMVGSIKGSFDYIKNLDTSLNDIRIVTGKSADEMERFARESNRAASKLGQTTKTYTDASLIYYQQGLSDKEVQARAETTLKAANITGQTGEEVSQELTAVWNGYKVSAEEAELYVDKLAAVAATTASDLEELSTGMSKVASAASVMGVPIDQLNAMLATTISVTRQAPESIGTAYKTIFARIGDIEAGEGEVTLGQYTTKMKELGFNVLDANQKLRDQGDVINEIGNNWKNLSREQQVALAQTMAGARQYNNLLALFDNWDMYTNALKTSADAAGTLNKQNETYLQSTEAHLNELAAAQERFQSTILDADSINTFADALKDLTDLASSFIEAIGGGSGVLLNFGSILTRVFSKQIAREALPAVRGIIAPFQNKKQIDNTLDILRNLKEVKDFGSEKAVAELRAKVEKDAKLFKFMTAEQQKQYYENLANYSDQRVKAEASDKRTAETRTKMSKYANYLSGKGKLAIDTEQYQEILSSDSVNFRDTDSRRILEARKATTEDLKGQTKILDDAWKQLKTMKDPGDAQAQIETIITEAKKLSGIVEDAEQLDIITDTSKEKQLKNINEILQAVKNLQDQLNSVPRYKDESQGQIDERKKLEGQKSEHIQIKTGLQEDLNNINEQIKYLETENKRFSDKKDGQGKSNFDRTVEQRTAELIQKEKEKLPEGSKLSTQKKQELKTQAIISARKDQEATEKMLVEYKEKQSKLNQKIIQEDKEIKEINDKIEETKKGIVRNQEEVNQELNETLQKEQKNLNNASLFYNVGEAGDAVGNTQSSNTGIVNQGDENVRSQNSRGNKDSDDLLVTQARAEATATAVVNLSSQIMEMGSIINNIQALPNILQNNEIDDGEKFGQIISNLAMTILPSAANAFYSLATAATAAQTAMGIIGVITMAIGAVIGVISAVVQAQENERKARIETNKAIIEENNSRLQEIDANTKLYNSYSEMEKKYKNGDISKKELLSSTDELIDAYDIENGKLLQLTDQYETLTGSIRRKRLEEAKENRDIAKKNVTASKKILQDSYNVSLEGNEKNPLWTTDVIKEKGFHVITQDDYKKAQEEAIKIANVLEKAGLDKTNFYISQRGNSVSLGIKNSIPISDLEPEQIKQLYDILSNLDPGSGEFGNTYSNFINDLKEYIESDEFAQYSEFTKEQNNADFLFQILDKNLDSATSYEEYSKILKQIQNEMSIDSTEFYSLVEGLGTEYSSIYAAAERLKEKTTDEKVKEKIDSLSKEDLAIVAALDIDEKTSVENIENAISAVKEQIKSEDLNVIATIRAEVGTDDLGNKIEENLTGYDDFTKNIENRSLFRQTEAINAIGSDYIKNNQNYLSDMLDADTRNQLYNQYQKDIVQLKKDYKNLDNYNQAKSKGGDVTLDDVTMEQLGLDIENEEEIKKLTEEYFNSLQDGGGLKEGKSLEEFLEKVYGKEAIEGFATANNYLDIYNQGLEKYGKELSSLEINNLVFDQLKEETNQILSNFDAIKEAGSLIGEGFVVAADDLEEFASKFPELLKDYEVLSDGSIKLSQKQVETTIGGIHEEQKAKAEAQIQELETQKELLQLRLDSIRKQKENALKFLQGEISQTEYEQNAVAVANQYKKDLSDTLAKNDIANFEEVLAAQGVTIEDEIKNVDKLGETYAKLGAYASAALRGQDPGEWGASFADAVISNSEELNQDVFDAIGSRYNFDELTKDDKEYFNKVLQEYKQYLSQEADLEDDIAEIDKEVVLLKSGINASVDSINDNLIDQLDLLDDVVDRYHDINNQLTQIEHIMNKINDEQEKSIGQNYINNLASQNKLLDTQIEKLRQKKDIQLAEAEELRGKLATKGFLFNEDGSMANYEAALQANIDLIREAQMSGDEDKAEQYEKQYNQMKEWLDRYDTLYNDEMPQLEEEITDKLNQKIENNIKKFNYQLELHVDLKELRKEFADFQKELLDDKDYTGILQIQANYLTNPDTLNLLGEQSQHVQDIMAEIQKMKNGQESSIFGDNLAAAYEELKTATKNLEDGTIDVKQAFDEALNTYLSMIDLTSEAMNEEKNLYDKIDEILTSRKNVISLVYGEESYKDFEMYYELQRQNNLESLNAARESVNYWASVMDQEEKGSEAWLKAKDNWQEAVSTLNSEIEQSITNLKEGYNNAIQSIFQEVNSQISNGKGLDNLKYEWDYVLEQSERYLDNVDKSYEISKLNSSINKQLSNTTSASIRQRLLDFQKKELDYLEKKDQLSQYDIDRSNKKLEILQAQIALEDAQNNKSQMRLRRDSQGNYSYQYVADTSAVDDAKEKLDAAIHDLYTLDKDRLKNTTQEWYNAWTSMQEELNEATQKYTGEQLKERTKQIQEKYKDILDGLNNDVTVSLNNLNQSSLGSLAATQQQAKVSTKSLVDYLTGSEGSGKLEKSFKDALSHIGLKESEILPPIANTDLPAVAGAAGRTESALDKMFDEVNRESAKFQSNLKDIENASGESFSSYITNAGTAYNKTKNLVNEQKELITQYKEKLGIGKNLLNSLDSVKNKFDNMKTSITNVLTEANKLFGKTYGIDLDTSGFTTAVDNIIAQIGRITTALGKIDYSKLTNGGAGGITSGSGTSAKNNLPENATAFQSTVYTKGSTLNKAGTQWNSNEDNSKIISSGATYLSEKKYTGYKNKQEYYQLYDAYGNVLADMNLKEKKRSSKKDRARVWASPYFGDQTELNVPGGTKTLYDPTPITVDGGKYYQIWYKQGASYVPGYVSSLSFESYDTGGYTGNWNSKEGRMAMLHEKELVLNAKDTKNILAAVNSVRAMQSIITSLDLNALAVKKQMISNLTAPIVAKEGLTNNNLNQNVQIEANFPNVRDARQIEEAFDNLVNMASQYANKQTR